MKSPNEISIEKMEREIQYLYMDYSKLLNRYHPFNEIRELRLKIKHAEESLRLKKKIMNLLVS